MTGTSTVERAARARAALVAAERRTGARSVLTGTSTTGSSSTGASAVRAATGAPASFEGTGVLGTLDVLEDARPGTSLSTVPAPDVPPPSAVTTAAPTAPRRTSLLTSERPPLPVPPALAALLPDGLRRGATTSVLGSTSLALGVLAHACASGAWAVAVGQPRLGLLAAAQAGVDLARFALVPDPGADAALVLAALIDGIDVVLVGPGTPLADADRRRLSARARERGAALLTTAPWPGAAVVLDAGPARWSGAGEGDGRLRSCEVQVRRTGRGSAAVPTSADVVLPFAPPGEHVPPGPVRRRPRTARGLRLVG
ncbi:hypothetical protein [Cellulomonas dongxiuzhuiae]|uniref:Uncharacterized protein n=1 Tax=Cellulomonas dongxiuzhuiae TaxID=2819979 RepID=A0ABX8GFW0_9CELL|nr:hypothetical protein [Cellulomonas dongxiuzhuiae]MBO3086995.1 hypothetical protein [Cellulomonas dongxiuzhuiae]MBO3093647.1 hypothetical protein [Cellulomonas dongxiuzhuiae]QWC14762.1 hypothetical protein KKR89_10315 [Cellulomonas dongxiuzhuiae]